MPEQRVRGGCERILAETDGRPGVDCLNRSRAVRVSPIQLFECPQGNSGGTAEKSFRPESHDSGLFLFLKEGDSIGSDISIIYQIHECHTGSDKTKINA